MYVAEDECNGSGCSGPHCLPLRTRRAPVYLARTRRAPICSARICRALPPRTHVHGRPFVLG